MKVLIYNNYEEMSKAVADVIAAQIRGKPDSFLCFPSGQSPTGILKYLVQFAREGTLDFSHCSFAGLDEWVGMDGKDDGSCRHYMDVNLFIPLGIKPEKILFFDALAGDLDKECKRMDSLIREKGTIDIMMVGVGMNGHIGLNEPGVDVDLYAHHTVLDALTIQIAQKYFKRETTLHEGITLGLRHLREADKAILIAAGDKKAGIIARALEGKVSREVPASIIQTIPEGLVFLDREAASWLRTSG
ncbi:6-phosphogluconolactonase [Flavitalea flava]